MELADSLMELAESYIAFTIVQLISYDLYLLYTVCDCNVQ